MVKSSAQDHREMPLPLRSLDLPPPFRLLVLREAGDAFAHASAHALDLGAGTLVFVGRFDVAEFAVVLEPEEELWSARRSFYAGMMAIADALSALAPPETPIAIEWPDRLEVGRGLVVAAVSARGTGTAVCASARMTRYSRSTAWALGSKFPSGLRRRTYVPLAAASL